MLKFFNEKEVLLIFDRGYPSIEFFVYLMEKGIKFLFRIKKKFLQKKKKNP